jgi:hypothetical protein
MPSRTILKKKGTVVYAQKLGNTYSDDIADKCVIASQAWQSIGGKRISLYEIGSLRLQ